MSTVEVAPRRCELEGCGRLHLARGMCARHYAKWYEQTTGRWRKRVAYQAAYREQHLEETRANARARTARYRERNPDQWREQRLAKYGLTPAAYEELLAQQNGVCAICGGTQPDGRRLYVDHCHFTGRVRGLLCVSCNRGLGSFQDNVDALRRAALYLEQAAKGVMPND